MKDELLQAHEESPTDELRRRMLAISRCIEAMGANSGKLIEVLQLGMLPEAVAREIEVTVRPFTASLIEMKTECVAFEKCSARINALIIDRQKAADSDTFFEKPAVARVN